MERGRRAGAAPSTMEAVGFVPIGLYLVVGLIAVVILLAGRRDN